MECRGKRGRVGPPPRVVQTVERRAGKHDRTAQLSGREHDDAIAELLDTPELARRSDRAAMRARCQRPDMSPSHACDERVS